MTLDCRTLRRRQAKVSTLAIAKKATSLSRLRYETTTCPTPMPQQPREVQLAKRAIVTAYRELRAAGSGELGTFQSCVILYRIHHPEAGLSKAREVVSDWIDQHINAATVA